MIRKMATCQVKPDQIKAVEAAIRQFLASIAAAEPDTSYKAYRIQERTGTST